MAKKTSSRRLSGPAIGDSFDPGNGSVTWWLFPLAGAVTEADGGGILRPFFSDCALVSHRHLAGVAARMAGSNANGLRETRCMLGLDPMSSFPVKDQSGLLETADWQTGVFHSYLAVRAAGTAGREHAEERAAEVAALLSVSLCLCAEDRGAVGLWGRRTLPVIDRLIALSADGATMLGVQLSRPRHHDSPIITTPFQLDRDPLEQLLLMKPVGSLAAILGPTGGQSHRLRSEFAASTVAIADALSAASLGVRVLRAVNAMEALLIPSDGDWQRLAPRVRVLLGAETYQMARGDECIAMRHDYVHRGSAPDLRLADAAIALSVATLFAASELVVALRDATIEQLREVLDAVLITSRLQGCLPDAASTPFATLSGLMPESIVPRWFHKMQTAPPPAANGA